MNKALLAFLFLPAMVSAQITAQWVRGFGTDGFPMERAAKVVTDAAGNSIVSGSSEGPHSGMDFLTIKYDQNGDTLWVRRYDSNKENDQVNALTIDASGNIYVAGYTSPNVYEEMTVVKYSPAGTQLWAIHYVQGTTRTFANDVAVDNSGNVYITGKIDSSNYINYRTWKYNSAGTLQWYRSYNGTGNYTDVANGICIDNNSDVIITGESYGPNTTNRYDAVTIKYSPAGNQLWLARFNSPLPTGENDGGIVVRTDANNNVYVAGNSYYYAGAQVDYMVLKYDPSGNQQWVALYNPNNGWEGLKDMALDNSGNCIVTGYSAGVGTGLDVATVKYDPAGNEVWARRHNGTAGVGDYGWGVACDMNDNVYVAAGVLNNPGSRRNFMMFKYDAAGNNPWTYTYHVGMLEENASDVAVRSNGEPVATGWAYQGQYTDEDYITATTDTAGNELWHALYNGKRTSDDLGLAMVLDANENIYGAGYSVDAQAWYRYDDVVVFKMDSMGNTVWYNKWNGPRGGNERANDIVLDDSGNVIVAGYTDTIVTNTKDILVIKYSPSGSILWTRTFAGTSNLDDEARKVTVDDAGCIYVTGYANMSGQSRNAVVLKYDPNGNLLWTYEYNGYNNFVDEAEDIVIDDSANVIITGFTQAGSAPGQKDVLIVKVDSSGALQWDTLYNSGAGLADWAHAICMDPMGNFIVTGYTQGNVLTIKYDANGNPLWLAVYSYSASVDEGLDVETDSFGNVNVVSKSNNFGDWDWATIQYSPSGSQNWVTRYDGPSTSDDEPYDLAMDTSGNIYVCGYHTQSFSTNLNVVILKYDSAGVQQWIYTWTSLSNFDDVAYDVAVAPSGHIYATGKTQEYNGFTATNKYDVYVVKLVPGLITSDPEQSAEITVANMHPNPANESIIVSVGDAFVPGMFIEVFNAEGQLVESKSMYSPSETIETATWASGTYFVSVMISGAEKLTTEKIIISH